MDILKWEYENDYVTTGEKFNVEGERWEIVDYNTGNTEMNLFHCGEHRCNSGHYWGPAVRNHYLIHYIVSGKGIFKRNNKTYELKAGNGFLICPDDVVFYQADAAEPWHYYWIGFYGLNCRKILLQANLSKENPIFYSDEADFFIQNIESMILANKLTPEDELHRLGNLYLFLSKLVQISSLNAPAKSQKTLMEEYITYTIDYIERNFLCDISVEVIASNIGINRKYLYTIFKKKLGLTPMEYIIKVRMEKACALLASTNLTLVHVCNSVGYKDQFAFSKQFKKSIGVSPTSYRNSLNKLNTPGNSLPLLSSP